MQNIPQSYNNLNVMGHARTTQRPRKQKRRAALCLCKSNDSL